MSNKCHMSRNQPITDAIGPVWESLELSLSEPSKDIKVLTTVTEFTLFQILLALSDRVEGFL